MSHQGALTPKPRSSSSTTIVPVLLGLLGAGILLAGVVGLRRD
jgi:hypothetical protein